MPLPPPRKAATTSRSAMPRPTSPSKVKASSRDRNVAALSDTQLKGKGMASTGKPTVPPAPPASVKPSPAVRSTPAQQRPPPTYDWTTTNLDALRDVDHRPELHPASAAVAAAARGGGGVPAVLSPIMAGPRQSPMSPVKDPAAPVDPVQFTKALAVGDARMRQQSELSHERRANLVYGAGILVAVASILTILGAVIFAEHDGSDAQLTVVSGQSPAGSYNGSLNDTDVLGDRGELLEMPRIVVGEKVTSVVSIDDDGGDDAETLSSSDNLEHAETAPTLNHAPQERSRRY